MVSNGPRNISSLYRNSKVTSVYKQNKTLNNMKVALVYDKINTQFGGAEVVLKAIHDLFPQAPLFTSIYDKNTAKWAQNINIQTSFLQNCTFLTKNHKILLPCMPLAFETLDLSEYDLIISITSAEAKGVLTKPHQKHICYLLTPTRYLHSHTQTYFQSMPLLQKPIIKQIAQLTFKYLRTWDIAASSRPDIIIPISKLVARRIKKYYKRKTSAVVYPPVSIELTDSQIQKISAINSTYFLSVSRLVAYKQVALSIQAALKLRKRLVVVGTGEEFTNLTSLAAEAGIIKYPNESLDTFFKRADAGNKAILFTKSIKTNEVYRLYKNCKALLMPGQEDFGITALEAGIFGKPVVVFYTSGVSEILQESKHAVFIKKESLPELTYALGKIDSLEFDSLELHANAVQYSIEQFKTKFAAAIEQELKG